MPLPEPISTPDADGQDLHELLQALGFGHWHSTLQLLFRRYAGWLTDYWLDSKFDLDLWPAGDVIKTLVNFPRDLAGNDMAFALTLSQCDFLVRQARDELTGEAWDALAQPYAAFRCEHKAEPFWGHEAPWPAEAFAAWALDRLRQDTEGPASRS
ncbi:hypothetical protein [Rubrivivax sp. A210]|uniref:hypothetical protein n=1 Tax=Rubrivivax sp. A210 TaxID=2772301 RepID=UPI001919FC29|nr:hypothetical protein [Rubrivivax sp. A210]